MTNPIITDSRQPAISDSDKTASPLAAALAELDLLAPDDEISVEFSADGTVTFSSKYTAPVTVRLPAGRITITSEFFSQLEDARSELARARRRGWRLTADPVFMIFALMDAAGEDAITVAS